MPKHTLEGRQASAEWCNEFWVYSVQLTNSVVLLSMAVSPGETQFLNQLISLVVAQGQNDSNPQFPQKRDLYPGHELGASVRQDVLRAGIGQKNGLEEGLCFLQGSEQKGRNRTPFKNRSTSTVVCFFETRRSVMKTTAMGDHGLCGTERRICFPGGN